MLDKEIVELKSKLAAIATGTTRSASDWRKTKILKWDGGFVEEALRIQQPEWWRRDSRGSTDLVEVNRLLQNAGLGKLQTRDDMFEQRRDAQKKENESGEPGVTANEVVEAQHNREKTAAKDEEQYQEYMPSPDENAWRWVDELPTKVDTNTPETLPWYSALSSYVHKFSQKTKARDLDQETVAKLVKQICDGGHDE